MVYVVQVCWQLASRIRTDPSWSCSQADQDKDGFVLILYASCQQTCTTYTIAVCTVKNSWWWTGELSETCRVLFQKYIWEISASSWFYYENISRCTVTWTSNLSQVCRQASVGSGRFRPDLARKLIRMDQDGFVRILFASCQQTCTTYTIAVCTVKNSWWWTEELSETCRVLFQK